MIKCTNCGAEQKDDAVFCSSCGKKNDQCVTDILEQPESTAIEQDEQSTNSQHSDPTTDANPEMENDPARDPDSMTLFERYNACQQSEYVNPITFQNLQSDLERSYFRYKLICFFIGFLCTAGWFIIFIRYDDFRDKILLLLYIGVVPGAIIMLLRRSFRKITGVDIFDSFDVISNTYKRIYGNKGSVPVGSIIGCIVFFYGLSTGVGFWMTVKISVFFIFATNLVWGFFWALKWWSLLIVIPIILLFNFLFSLTLGSLALLF